MQEVQVRSLGWEDPLEEEMATRSSILAWRIPWTVEPGGLPVRGVAKTYRLNRQHVRQRVRQYAHSYTLLSLLFGPPQGVSQFVKHIHAQGHIVVCCRFYQECSFSVWESPF